MRAILAVDDGSQVTDGDEPAVLTHRPQDAPSVDGLTVFTEDLRVASGNKMKDPELELFQGKPLVPKLGRQPAHDLP